MRELWQKTAALFWERPILWVPVLCADFLRYWLWTFEDTASRKLVIWLLYKHSVLGGLVPRTSGSEISLILKAALIGAPPLWGSYFLDICFYTSALLMTSALAEMIVAESKPDLLVALRFMKLRLRRVVPFSLKVFLFLVGGAVIFASTLGRFGGGLTRMYIYGFGATAIWSALIAYFMAPAAILLLRDSQSALLKRESAVRGRAFAIAATIAVSAIAYFATLAEQSSATSPIFAHGAPVLAVNCVASLVAALPYIPLFIALSLIEKSDTAESEVATVGSGI